MWFQRSRVRAQSVRTTSIRLRRLDRLYENDTDIIFAGLGRDRLNADIQQILDQQTDAWGIKVANVEIKHVDLNESMVRAIAKQAEAERLRRAKVINAAGEQQAAEKLVEAGKLLAVEPRAMQLRYFAALHDIASERSSTIVFPLPMDLLSWLSEAVERPTVTPPATGSQDDIHTAEVSSLGAKRA